MNKRFLGIVYVLALLVTLAASFFSIPVTLAWILRGAVLIGTLACLYFVNRNKDEYRYTVAKDREKGTKK